MARIFASFFYCGKYKMSKFKNSKGLEKWLKIRNAPEPDDIFFENLTDSDWTRFKKSFKSWILTILLIGTCFGIQFGCKHWQ